MKPQALAAVCLAALLCDAAAAAPARMQAAVQTGPDSIEVRTVDTPRPAAGEVLVRILAAGINPVDHKRLPVEKTMPDGSVRAAVPVRACR